MSDQSSLLDFLILATKNFCRFNDRDPDDICTDLPEPEDGSKRPTNFQVAYTQVKAHWECHQALVMAHSELAGNSFIPAGEPGEN